jgi:hypothetical protein
MLQGSDLSGSKAEAAKRTGGAHRVRLNHETCENAAWVGRKAGAQPEGSSHWRKTDFDAIRKLSAYIW